MAFLLNKTSLSHLRRHSQKSEDLLMVPRRGLHVELGAREKALLAEDPALGHFKSHKKGVQRIRSVGAVLTVVAVAGALFEECVNRVDKYPPGSCCYEIYVQTNMREETRQGLAL